jgi:hypothetical protein
MGHARALLGLGTDADRVRVARWVVERGLSVRATEGLVRKAMQTEPPSRGRPELSVLREVMRTETLNVQLEQKSSGAARIVIDVRDAGVRDALIEAIRAVAERR